MGKWFPSCSIFWTKWVEKNPAIRTALLRFVCFYRCLRVQLHWMIPCRPKMDETTSENKTEKQKKHFVTFSVDLSFFYSWETTNNPTTVLSLERGMSLEPDDSLLRDAVVSQQNTSTGERNCSGNQRTEVTRSRSFVWWFLGWERYPFSYVRRMGSQDLYVSGDRITPMCFRHKVRPLEGGITRSLGDQNDHHGY